MRTGGRCGCDGEFKGKRVSAEWGWIGCGGGGGGLRGGLRCIHEKLDRQGGVPCSVCDDAGGGGGAWRGACQTVFNRHLHIRQRRTGKSAGSGSIHAANPYSPLLFLDTRSTLLTTSKGRKPQVSSTEVQVRALGTSW